MANYQVIGIRRPNQKSTHDQITHIAYIESFFNSRVVITIEEAIRRIAKNNKEFYIRGVTNMDYLEVVNSDEGKTFIKTRQENNKRDNLLRLQGC
ncbi:MAG: hypothetical protein JWQ84_2067 [Mucilaginibacter sp.]|nr:hypothetical protein [Mucilaginibacter sp.]MDB5017235.1 hypothetical protein [Mucilaginibacter sp.]MDB5140130.1 hypothetical protein [Mucilaginibacter sp.]